jgi:hypothetical protein
MTAITFDSTTVDSIEVTKIDQLGTTTTLKFECTVACQTVTYANYTALVAKAGIVNKSVCWPTGKTSIQSVGGTKGDLVLNGTTYTNCYIESISAAEAPNSVLGVWHFTISFVKDTSL